MPPRPPACIREALKIDLSNDRARRGLAGLELDARSVKLLAESERLLREGNIAGAQERVDAALADNPANANAQRQQVVDPRAGGKGAAGARCACGGTVDHEQAGDAAVSRRQPAHGVRGLVAHHRAERDPRPRRARRSEDHDLRQGRSRRRHRGPDPAAEPVGKARAERQHAVHLPGHRGQAEGVPGPAGAHVPGHQHRRQVPADAAEDRAEGEGHLGRRAQRHAGDARHAPTPSPWPPR